MDYVLDDMAEKYHNNSSTKLDAIIVTGDMVVHGLSSKDFSINNWEKQKEIIKETMDSMTKRFPDVPIINAVGNNDAIHHYQAPNGTFKETFYGDLFEIWIQDHVPNHGKT